MESSDEGNNATSKSQEDAGSTDDGQQSDSSTVINVDGDDSDESIPELPRMILSPKKAMEVLSNRLSGVKGAVDESLGAKIVRTATLAKETPDRMGAADVKGEMKL